MLGFNKITAIGSDFFFEYFIHLAIWLLTPSGDLWATDSMSAYAHVMTITVTILKDFVCSVLLSSPGKSFIVDNDEHALCCVACFYWASSLTTWFCVMCYSRTWVPVLLLFSSHCDQVTYTSQQHRRFLHASLSVRVMLRSLCHALKLNSKWLIFNFLFGDPPPSCVKTTCT